MSRHLPDRPSLEYLKKEAKALLEDIQQRNPDAQLADALHQLARAYGFDSWPKLKAHVNATANGGASRANPFTGDWIADVARSRPHPSPFRAATIDCTVDGNVVVFRSVFVDASDRIHEITSTLDADGEEHLQASGSVVRAQWVASHVLDVVMTKDGQLEGRVTYTISNDDRTLVVSTAEQTGVFDRAGDGQVFTKQK